MRSNTHRATFGFSLVFVLGGLAFLFSGLFVPKHGNNWKKVSPCVTLTSKEHNYLIMNEKCVVTLDKAQNTKTCFIKNGSCGKLGVKSIRKIPYGPRKDSLFLVLMVISACFSMGVGLTGFWLLKNTPTFGGSTNNEKKTSVEETSVEETSVV
jgi:hypothetical protein